jgi:hypothetical protein
MRHLFLVSEQHGGPWDWSKGLRDQEGFDEHARFMEGLVDDRFVVLGGPLDERDPARSPPQRLGDRLAGTTLVPISHP